MDKLSSKQRDTSPKRSPFNVIKSQAKEKSEAIRRATVKRSISASPKVRNKVFPSSDSLTNMKRDKSMSFSTSTIPQEIDEKYFKDAHIIKSDNSKKSDDILDGNSNQFVDSSNQLEDINEPIKEDVKAPIKEDEDLKEPSEKIIVDDKCTEETGVDNTIGKEITTSSTEVSEKVLGSHSADSHKDSISVHDIKSKNEDCIEDREVEVTDIEPDNEDSKNDTKNDHEDLNLDEVRKEYQGSSDDTDKIDDVKEGNNVQMDIERQIKICDNDNKLKPLNTITNTDENENDNIATNESYKINQVPDEGYTKDEEKHEDENTSEREVSVIEKCETKETKSLLPAGVKVDNESISLEQSDNKKWNDKKSCLLGNPENTGSLDSNNLHNRSKEELQYVSSSPSPGSTNQKIQFQIQKEYNLNSILSNIYYFLPQAISILFFCTFSSRYLSLDLSFSLSFSLFSLSLILSLSLSPYLSIDISLSYHFSFCLYLPYTSLSPTH